MIRSYFLIVAAIFLSLPSPFWADIKPVLMRVNVAVTDVRTKPLAHSGRYEYDSLQETQLEMDDPSAGF
jgi:hypothetical protein